MPNLDGDVRGPGEGTLYVSFPSLNNPAAQHHTMEALELVDPDVVEQWRGTTADDRPGSYEEFKRRLEERLTARLEGRFETR